MKVQMLYDQGSSQYREDGFFAGDQFFGVLDGVSAPFSREHPPQKFWDSLSGGEMVARVVSSVMGHECGGELPAAYLRVTWDFRDAVRYVNKVVLRSRFAGEGLHLAFADEIPGATFAFARVGEEKVEIVQAGDCLALIAFKDGRVFVTENQVRCHDTEMNDTILRLQREIAKEKFGIALEETTPEQSSEIRAEMWNRFYHILKAARRADVNNPASPRCYGLLNGQLELEEVWNFYIFPREELATLLLFSDGMVPWEVMKGLSDQEIARRVLADYREGGLTHLLRVARGVEKRVERVNYTDSAEATAIALEF